MSGLGTVSCCVAAMLVALINAIITIKAHILKLFFITMSQGIEVQKYNDWPTLPNLETNFIKNICLTLFQFGGKDFGTIAPYLCSVNQSQVVDEAPQK
ncbi:MAG: hypothetical protein II691_01655 [Muribaculaceae bacterium]|nr:hypothetical protein [Muribaculaceae bacterium]